MIELIKADITKQAVDAVVSAAGLNHQAIAQASGPEMAKACAAHGPLATGQVYTTPGFQLPARTVIHVVGPVWTGGGDNEPAQLEQTYARVFARAHEEGAKSIAVPCISTGEFPFPANLAARIALRAMRAYEGKFSTILACMPNDATYQLYEKTLVKL